MHFDEDAVQRHFDTWHWLLENLGGISALKRSQLILPTSNLFPRQAICDHAFALKTFEAVKEMMGMTDWPCHLEQFDDSRDNNPARRHGLYGEWSSNGPAGLYVKTEDGVFIGYSRAQLEKPGSLVATLAHELCHYLLGKSARSHPPGGWKDHELHTDTACSFMGFGIFSCNAVFDFQRWGGINESQGWKWSRQGYLSEGEHAYALALYCKLTDTDPKKAAVHLKTNPRNYFEMALDDIAHRPEDILRLLNVADLPQSLPPILSMESPPAIPSDSPSIEMPEFTLEDVGALGSEKPWYAPLWNFYVKLVSTQTNECWHENEFSILPSIRPSLRDALLAVRFSIRFEQQGLQGAIILDDATDSTPCLQMLEKTIRAFEALGDTPRAQFLQNLTPEIDLHFVELELAEKEDTLDTFFSPLDQDETWRGLDLHWNHQLRKLLRGEPDSYVYP